MIKSVERTRYSYAENPPTNIDQERHATYGSKETHTASDGHLSNHIYLTVDKSPKSRATTIDGP